MIIKKSLLKKSIIKKILYKKKFYKKSRIKKYYKKQCYKKITDPVQAGCKLEEEKKFNHYEAVSLKVMLYLLKSFIDFYINLMRRFL